MGGGVWIFRKDEKIFVAVWVELPTVREAKIFSPLLKIYTHPPVTPATTTPTPELE
jgi:hypothetical protein